MKEFFKRNEISVRLSECSNIGGSSHWELTVFQ